MAHFTYRQFVQYGNRNTLPRVPQEARVPWQTLQNLTEAGAYAIGLPNGFQFTSPSNRSRETVLLSVDDAVTRLAEAPRVSGSDHGELNILACTYARDAQYLAHGEDRRDHLYLMGTEDADGLPAYCGGLNAAIHRALAYAPYADAICFYAARLDLAEAEHFASVVGSAFPEKELGFGSPLATLETQRGTQDYASCDAMLRKMGYSYRFFRHCNSIFFSSTPPAVSWVLFDDIAAARTAADAVPCRELSL